jgi:hypothetical protein
MLAGSELLEDTADLADPVCAGIDAGAAAQDGGVVDLDGRGVDLGFEAGEVVGVVVEGLFSSVLEFLEDSWVVWG